MQDDGFVHLPQQLDAPPKFFIWDFDIVSLFVLGIFFGVYMGSLIIGLILGRSAVALWEKLSEGQARGFGIHSLYWVLPLCPFKNLPPSSQRDFQG